MRDLTVAAVELLVAVYQTSYGRNTVSIPVYNEHHVFFDLPK